MLSSTIQNNLFESIQNSNNSENSTPNKLFLSEYGTHGKIYALGVQGDRKFIHQTHNFLINYGVVGETAMFHPIFENFGYFVIDIEKYKIGLEVLFRNLLWIKERDENKVCYEDFLYGKNRILNRQKIKNQVKDHMDSLILENFMEFTKTKDSHLYFTKMKY